MADQVSSGQAAEDSESTQGLFARRSEALRGALIRFFQRHVRDSDEANDLVQEVFLRVVRRGRCDELQSLDGYIFQTASSVLKDRGRRRRTRHSDRHVSFEAEMHSGTTAGPDSLLLNRETLLEVSRVLLELPENTRRVFVLRRLEEMPYREIAIRLGISVSAVEKHMLRAVRHLIARSGMFHE